MIGNGGVAPSFLPRWAAFPGLMSSLLRRYLQLAMCGLGMFRVSHFVCKLVLTGATFLCAA